MLRSDRVKPAITVAAIEAVTAITIEAVAE